MFVFKNPYYSVLKLEKKAVYFIMDMHIMKQQQLDTNELSQIL